MARHGHGDGSIYKRSDGRWAVGITLEGEKRNPFYGKTRKEVQEKLKVALYEQHKGMLATGPQQKVEQFLVHWLENVHKRSIRGRTYERYEQILRFHLVPALGHYPLEKLLAQHLQSFSTSKREEEGLSATTVISFHHMLHKARETAVRWKWIAQTVCDLVLPPRRKPFAIQPLSLEQVEHL